MLDNQLLALVLSTAIAQEAIAGIAGTPIAQSFQPTQQGVNKKPTAFIHKLYDKRIGFPFREDVYDADEQVMRHTEKQQYESTFQMSALAIQDPAIGAAQYTASDIVNLFAYILQSAATVAAFEAQDVGILRVTDVRNPYFKDDAERFEANPSFDFTLTHKQIVSSEVPVLQSTEFKILPV